MRYIKAILFGILSCFAFLVITIFLINHLSHPIQFILPFLEKSLSNPYVRVYLKTHSSQIKWGGWKNPLSIHLSDTSIHIPKLNLKATIPHLIIFYEWGQLCRGMLEPDHVVVDEFCLKNQGNTCLNGAVSLKWDTQKCDLKLDVFYVDFTTLVHYFPFLKGKGLNATGNLWLQIGFDGKIYPSFINLTVEKGEINLPNFFYSPIPVTFSRLFIEMTDSLLKIKATSNLHNGAIIKGKAVLETTRWLDLWSHGGVCALHLEADARACPVNDISIVWPKNLSPVPRQWVLENLSKGQVEEGWVTLASHIIFNPLGDIKSHILGNLDGYIEAKGIDVHYLGSLPRVTQTRALCLFNADNFSIEAQGKAGPLSLTYADVDITHLREKDQEISLDLFVEGPAECALAVISQNPLRLPEKLGLTECTIQGDSDNHVFLQFPLERQLELSDISIYTSTKIRNGLFKKKTSYGPVILTKGNFNLTANKEKLILNGTGHVFGCPCHIKWAENFQNIPFSHLSLFKRQLHVETLLPHTHVPQNFSYFKGDAALEACFTTFFNEKSSLKIIADLTSAFFSFPVLNVEKNKGIPSFLNMDVSCRSDGSAIIDSLAFKAPNLYLQAQGEYEGFHLKYLTLKDSTLFKLPVTGGVRLKTDKTLALSMHLPFLNLRSFNKLMSQDYSAERAYGPLRSVSLKVDDIFFHDNYRLHNVEADFLLMPTALKEAAVKGGISGGTHPFLLTVKTGKRDNQLFMLKTGNGGEFLEFLETGYNLKGGNLQIEGHIPHKDITASYEKMKIVGKLSLTNFDVQNPPLGAKIVSGLSLIDLPRLIGGEGMRFQSGLMDFNVNANKLTINRLTLSSLGLGLFLRGFISPEKTDLSGYITPFNLLNQVVANIPVMGKILSHTYLGTVFSTPLEIKGTQTNLKISTNPFKTILPVVFHDFFKKDWRS